MILNDFIVPKSKYSNETLDKLLAELCELVIKGKQDNPDFSGWVGAAIITPEGLVVTGTAYRYGNKFIHAERAAIDKYEAEYGELPKGCIVVTTLSPCNEDHDETATERQGDSCTDLLNKKHIKLAYCGYRDPTQADTHNKFTVIITENNKLKTLCNKLADTFLKKSLREESNKQILSYIKKIHPKGEFTIDHAVMNHAEWELTSVPLSSLHIDTDEVSPYDQINWIDYDHVKNITAQDIKNKPIVVDNAGWIIDGNHRAVAARDMGMTKIPAYIPVESEDDDEETYDQHMARVNKERDLSEVLEWDDQHDPEVEEWQTEDVRQHLLTMPHLFENDERYTELKKFLNNQNTVHPVIGKSYAIVTIKSLPLGNTISIAKTVNSKLLLDITATDYIFKFGNRNRIIPKARFDEGDLLSYTLLFDNVNNLEHFIVLLKLKYSEWKTLVKDLLETFRKKITNEVIHHPGIKTKHADTSGLVNHGEPVPLGKEQKLLGNKVGRIGAYEVYKWDKGNDSAYSVYDPKTRISQMTISGHNKAHAFEIFGIYGGPKAPIRAADLYAWLVKNQGLTLLSDKYQSPGGQRVWQELEQRYGRSINVYAFNMKTNKPINTGADDPESTHGYRGDTAQNVRLVAAPK